MPFLEEFRELCEDCDGEGLDEYRYVHGPDVAISLDELVGHLLRELKTRALDGDVFAARARILIKYLNLHLGRMEWNVLELSDPELLVERHPTLASGVVRLATDFDPEGTTVPDLIGRMSDRVDALQQQLRNCEHEIAVLKRRQQAD